jgi:hypothetical protein
LHTFERKPARLLGVVVTLRAVAIENAPVLRDDGLRRRFGASTKNTEQRCSGRSGARG